MVQFTLDIRNQGQSDLNEPFTLEFSLQTGHEKHTKRIQVPTIQARETKGVKITFTNLDSETTQSFNHIQQMVGFLVDDRVGLHLDVNVQDVSPRDIGWETRIDEIFFNFNLDQDDMDHTETFNSTDIPFRESLCLSGVYHGKSKSGYNYSTYLFISVCVIVILGYGVSKRKQKSKELVDDFEHQALLSA